VIEAITIEHWGRIINISSINGEGAQLRADNYSAAKAACTVHDGYGPRSSPRKGIPVNTVSPGTIATDMVMAVREDVREKIVQTIPVKRWARRRKSHRSWPGCTTEDAGFTTGARFFFGQRRLARLSRGRTSSSHQDGTIVRGLTALAAPHSAVRTRCPQTGPEQDGPAHV